MVCRFKGMVFFWGILVSLFVQGNGWSFGPAQAHAAGNTIYVNNVDYNASGQIVKIEYGNGVVTDYVYDPNNLRLQQLTSRDALGNFLQNLVYAFDRVGNIVSVTDGVYPSESQTFEYDQVDRLVKAIGSYGTKTYTYDEIGNIKTKDGLTYTYGGVGHRPHAVANLSDGTNFTYDANGNMTAKLKPGSPTAEYVYDVEGRLTAVKQNGSAIEEYLYDGDGGRTRKKIYGASAAPAGGLSFPELIGSGFEAEHYLGSVYEKGAHRTTKHIFLGGKRVASVTNGQVVFLHENYLGSTNIITDARGVKKERIEYEPYGLKTKHEKYGGGEEVAWHYFTGQRLDEKTGLYYYGARYYNPAVGRFITPDTMIAYPENPQDFNRYSYVHNNPVNLTDPTGNFAWFIPAIVAAVKGAVAGAAIGAGFAAATGGNIGQGALMGAIGGAALGGFSNLTGSLIRFASVPGGIGPMTAGANFASNILGGVIGGAATGASVAGYLGANPLNGAGFGAVSGGVFGGIGMLGGKSWGGDLARVALAGVAGGGISELAGGSFGYGAAFAGTIAGADFIYRAIMRTQGYEHGASMNTAKRPGAPKLDYDKNGKIIALKVIHDPSPLGDGFSNVGGQSLPGAKGFLHFLGGETGPVMSFLGTKVPGFQGLSHVHDITSDYLVPRVGRGAFMVFLNFQTMPPIYGLNAAGAAINDNPATIGIYEVYGGKND